MRKVSYDRHRFPAQIIQYAVWLYFRFALSYHNVEHMLAERGIDVSYETVRRWALKFGEILCKVPIELGRCLSPERTRWIYSLPIRTYPSSEGEERVD